MSCRNSAGTQEKVEEKVFPAEKVPQARPSTSDYFEEWGPYGECSRTCGVGVSMRTRRCVSQRTDGVTSCVGPAVSYRTCNVQDCPMGSRDFREEQCAQFDTMDFQGARYRWLPYYGAENPCELNCAPRGENFFFRHRASVVDGTPCRPGSADICVEGMCRRLGCDKMLESQQREDPCLECGGNGHSCYLIKNTFTTRNLPQAGYNQMFIIPAGATTIRIRETIATRNRLAIRNQHGEYYLNGNGVTDFSRAIRMAGTVMYYERGIDGDMSPESIISRGPTTEALTVELVTQEHNLGVEFSYYIPYEPSQVLPPTPSRGGYTWSTGAWSACSRECGSGFQSRTVLCVMGGEVSSDQLCASMPRPSSNRTCNMHQCQETYSWSLGEWSTCSATCGRGSQTRSVHCVAHDGARSRVVDDSMCAMVSGPPPSLQVCEHMPCAEYSVSSWSVCSVTCGEGTQTREVFCVGGRAERVPESACSSLHRPQVVQTCRRPACHHRISWHVGNFGLCSRSCGSGTRERQVICSDMDHNLYSVDQCEMTPKPPTVESCNDQPCHSPQMVPSMQNPRGHDPTLYGFRPYVPGDPSGHRPIEIRYSTPTVYEPPRPHCSQSYYGCCPDGRTAATGFRGEGCAMEACARSRYGCCADGVTAALGPGRAGCLDATLYPRTCHSSTYGCCSDGVTPATGPEQHGCPTTAVHGDRSSCSLPSSVGPCTDWTPRYYYDASTSTCIHFWYGGCQGNSNNFPSREECQRICHGVTSSHPSPTTMSPRRAPRPGSRRVITVVRGSSRRLGSSAAAHAQSVRAPHRRIRHTTQHAPATTQ
ncbi:hypothetical protein JZ751_004878 [Albula glossodonta]|uniref:Papilin n=1 Tax=Albula glossodonta TaxID=121402 RepID=A0A8T2P7T1_9TELE|nr:hypothetical protein JZ751_004878 [Albula glossodonta]